MFLIIGSANRDILADYGVRHRAVLDKPGTFCESMGGTACNIARNLARHGNRVSLYTHVRKGGVNEGLLRSLYSKYNFDPRGLVADETLPESAFIGIREDGELVTAVNVIGLEQARFDYALLKELAEEAEVIVADANLTAAQLEAVFDLANSLGKTISLTGVSEGKAYRTLSAANPTTAPSSSIVVMNQLEATAFLGRVWDLMEPDLVCNMLGSAAVCVTRGADGFSVLTRENGRHDFPAAVPPRLVSTTGAGDALMAAILHFLYVDKGQWSQRVALQRRVEQYVFPVLASNTSEPL
jgi:sugar/nucleoside kinase (ribokinase family)